MYISLYRIIFCISLLLIKDLSACLVVKTSDSLLGNLLDVSISIPPHLDKDETPYSFWCKKIQESYQGHQEEKDKNCFEHIFSKCTAPGFEPLNEEPEIPCVLDYYQRSIQSWKNIDIPNENHLTLFMHHIYLLDQFSPVTEQKQFDQLSTIYSTILRRWDNTLHELWEGNDADLNSYLPEGNQNLKSCCADLVDRIKKPLDMQTIHNNVNTLIEDVLSRKHITPFQKELFFWYGFQLLSLSCEKKEILDCVKEAGEKIKPQGGETWQQEIFEYLLQAASILETNIIFKDKDFFYGDSIADSISADTLQCFGKSKDNFFLKKFIPQEDKFHAIVSFYASKVAVKKKIEALDYLLKTVSERNLQIIQPASNNKYELTAFGKKIHDDIISVGCSSESYCDKNDLAMINTIKHNDIVRLITQNRHILSVFNYNNLLCSRAQRLLTHTDLQYDDNQKKYIQFQEQQAAEPKEVDTPVEKHKKHSIENKLEPSHASFLTKKLFLGGIGISIVGLLGFLYYIEKNPEAYFSLYVQDIFNQVRSLRGK